MSTAEKPKLYPHSENSLGSILGSPRQQAEMLAHGLGIPFYVGQDGTITQMGPGERIDSPAGSLPMPHGAAEMPKKVG